MRVSLALLALASSVLPAMARAQAATAAGAEPPGVAVALHMTAAKPDQTEVSSQADLTGQLDHLQTHVQVGLQAGAKPAGEAQTGWWNSTAASVGAVWTPTPMAKVELSAQDSARLEFAATDPVFTDGAQHYVENRQSAVSAGATLTPVPALALKFGALASATVKQNAAVSGAGAETSDLVQAEARRLSAELEWTPRPAVVLTAGSRLESTGLAWSAGRATTSAALNPSASLALAPWTGSDWRLSLDRASTSLSTDQFVGYGAGLALDRLASLTPSSEWRYTASLTQKAGPVELGASALRADVRTYAYLAPYGGQTGRVGLGEGQRGEVSARLAAPLSVRGLAPFVFNASAAWRDSAVQDPLTGLAGRMSGEAPYSANLSLSQTIDRGLSWGMTAVALGPLRSYWASQTTSLTGAAGLGGFVQLHAQPVTLRLTLDNVLGGERDQRDVFYVGPRDLNVIDRTDQSRIVDRVVRIALIRPL